MIRPLSPDEVVWFVSRGLAFQGHPDPMGLARRIDPLMRDVRRQAMHAFVWHPPAQRPLAGAVLEPKRAENVDATVRFGLLWHEGDALAAEQFISSLLARVPHDAVAVDLHGVPAGAAATWLHWLGPLGFAPRERVVLHFDLSDVPPLGLPLILEGWTLESDAALRRLYASAERLDVSDAHWSWRKRHGGRFEPDLWFLVRETPDQEAMGYAFVHAAGDRNARDGFDTKYRLEAAGVLPEYRGDSEAARRLLLTLLRELAGRSPFGTILTEADANDGPWMNILYALGFREVGRSRTLERTPG